jgi:4-azaleucine resistance transporter AzlC
LPFACYNQSRIFVKKALTGEGDLRKITKKDVAAAFRTSSPIIVTFVVLGIGYGILMQKHGYGPLWSVLSGFIIFSGTAQFVSVTMLSSGSVIMAALTSLMISARC